MTPVISAISPEYAKERPSPLPKPISISAEISARHAFPKASCAPVINSGITAGRYTRLTKPHGEAPMTLAADTCTRCTDSVAFITLRAAGKKAANATTTMIGILPKPITIRNKGTQAIEGMDCKMTMALRNTSRKKNRSAATRPKPTPAIKASP